MHLEGQRTEEEEEVVSSTKSSRLYVPPCTALSSRSADLSSPSPPISLASLPLCAAERDPYGSSDRLSKTRDLEPLDSTDEVDNTRTACPSSGCESCERVKETGRDRGAVTVLADGDWLDRRVDAAECAPSEAALLALSMY